MQATQAEGMSPCQPSRRPHHRVPLGFQQDHNRRRVLPYATYRHPFRVSKDSPIQIAAAFSPSLHLLAHSNVETLLPGPYLGTRSVLPFSNFQFCWRIGIGGVGYFDNVSPNLSFGYLFLGFTRKVANGFGRCRPVLQRLRLIRVRMNRITLRCALLSAGAIVRRFDEDRSSRCAALC